MTECEGEIVAAVFRGTGLTHVSRSMVRAAYSSVAAYEAAAAGARRVTLRHGDGRWVELQPPARDDHAGHWRIFRFGT